MTPEKRKVQGRCSWLQASLKARGQGWEGDLELHPQVLVQLGTCLASGETQAEGL